MQIKFDHARVFIVSALLAAALAVVLLPRAVRAQAGPQKWALLIGIDDYQDRSHIHNLGAAAADARALKAALIETAGFPEQNVRLLVSDAELARGEMKPTFGDIMRELELLTQRVKPGDTVFILYSGHGIETDGKAYLLPYDSQALDADLLTSTAIPISVFRKRLQAVQAGTMILAFDMCRTDPSRGSRGVNDANKLTVTEVKSLALPGTGPSPAAGPAPVVAVLFACSPDERSYEWAEKGHGYFSFFLEQGLRGRASDKNGTVHLDRLADYVTSNVEKEVRQHEAGQQTPFVDIPRDAAGGHPDVILATGVFPVAAPVAAAATDITTVETTATFRLMVSPSGSTITIDGMPSGKIANVDLGIDKSKTVTVRVTAPGCVPDERPIKLQRGSNPPVVVLLSGTPDAIAAASRTSGGPAAGDTPGLTDLTGMLRGAYDGGARATFQREDSDSGGGTFTARITAVASDPARVRAGCRVTTLVEGRTYEVRFRARADTPRTMAVGGQTADNAAPRNLGPRAQVRVGTAFQDYQLTFRAVGISRGTNNVPLFILGDRVGWVQIAGVSLKLVDGP